MPLDSASSSVTSRPPVPEIRQPSQHCDRFPNAPSLTELASSLLPRNGSWHRPHAADAPRYGPARQPKEMPAHFHPSDGRTMVRMRSRRSAGLRHGLPVMMT